MYACIDLGSNSFHLLIARWQDDRSEIVERFSNLVQLGEGVSLTGNISPAAFARGLECLKEFSEALTRHSVCKYWALGTNALRTADNAPEFIAEAAKLGVEISIISGLQEAVLVYSGVQSGLPRQDVTRLVVDIGGGSTEVIVGRQERRLVTHSLAVGCVAWRDRYFSELAGSPAGIERQLETAVKAAFDVFSAVREEVRSHPWSEVYASSGTAKMLAMVGQSCGYGGGDISRSMLHYMKQDVVACAGEPELLLPGLKDRRRDLLLPGWAVMTGLMQALDIERINFSATALREGMLDFMMHKGSDTSLLERELLPEVSQTGL